MNQHTREWGDTFHEPGPPLDLTYLDRDPDRPHPYVAGDLGGISYGGAICQTCRGTRANTLHIEPLGGWDA